MFSSSDPGLFCAAAASTLNTFNSNKAKKKKKYKKSEEVFATIKQKDAACPTNLFYKLSV